MIISRTPLRVSFVGGGTDIPVFYKQSEGCVLSTTIDKYIYVILKERIDNNFLINHYKQERVLSIDEIKHDLIRECLKLLQIKRRMNITILSDVSVHGTGLGSSSALTVGLLNALYAYIGEDVTIEKIAQMACRVEMNILKHPIGKQDQYASAYGGMNILRFYSDEKVVIEKIKLTEQKLQEFFNNLFMIYTGINRNANEVLIKQIKNINHNKNFLKKMSHMPQIMRGYLEHHRFDEIGKYLNEAWYMKKNLSNSITNIAVDEIFENGIKAGALGGKLLGAGQGGYVLFYVPYASQNNFNNLMLSKYKIVPIGYEEFGSKIVYDSKKK